jgi:hypothetical protein
LAPLVQKAEVPGVSIVPSSWLVGIEKALAGEVGAETLLRKSTGDLAADKWRFCPTCDRKEIRRKLGRLARRWGAHHASFPILSFSINS